MRYAYKARSASGETSAGTVEADSPLQVHRKLREKGFFPLSVDLDSERRVSRAAKRFSRGKVSKRDLLTFTTQLAVMSRAGMDLAGAIETTARQCPNPILKATLERVHQEVTSGKAVSASLASQGHVFGEAYVASVASGEASGRLPDVLNRLSQLLRSELRLRSTMRQLLSYPIMLASTCFLVICALMFFVLPQFSGVFKQLGVPLPAMTQVLLAISQELRTHWWFWATFFVSIAIGLMVFQSRPAGRRVRDRLALNMPLVRDVTRSLLVGRTFRLLGTMLDSGVPLLEGLHLTSASVRNSLYRRLFEKIRTEVLTGRGMGETLAMAEFVPPAASQMVLTAERTGTVGSVMQLMGEFYEEEGETRLRELATILEPLIIVVMGTVVAFVVMSVMLPLFDFASVANGHN